MQGSGLAATQSRVLPGFSRLDLAGSGSVTVVTGGRQSVVVRADNNLIRYVTTRVAAGTLVIGTTGSYTTRTPMSVKVSAPSLAAVTLSGSGAISVADAADTGEARDDVPPAELANYCLHALQAASSLPSEAAAHRLVTVTLAGLHLPR